jgi:hypothetical protein
MRSLTYVLSVVVCASFIQCATNVDLALYSDSKRRVMPISIDTKGFESICWTEFSVLGLNLRNFGWGAIECANTDEDTVLE